MYRKLMTGLLTVLLIAGLLAAGAGPARSQDDMETFRKPAWRLTLQYPPGWEVSEDSAAVSIVFEGEGDDLAIFAVAQDPDYADTELSLEDLFWVFMDKVGGEADNLNLEETEPRQIAGVEARSGYLTATDAGSGLELDGDIYQLVKGGKGYLVLALSAWNYLEAHQPEFDSMLDSLRIGATAAPTKTPTPKPRRTARPTATPTEESVETPEVEPTEEAVETPEVEPTEEAIETPEVEPTEEAVETPEAEPTSAAVAVSPTITVTTTVDITTTSALTATPAVEATSAVTPTAAVSVTVAITVTPSAASAGVYLSAKEALDIALASASGWDSSAILTFVKSPAVELAGPHQGKGRSWTFRFVAGGDTNPDGFEFQVEDGKVTRAAEQDPGITTREIASQWLNSPRVISTALRRLGTNFKIAEWYGHPVAQVELLGGFSGPELSFWHIWIPDASSSTPEAKRVGTFTLTALATSGDLLELSDDTNKAARKPLTARQALTIAEKKARQWADDVELVAAIGEAQAGDPGQTEGKGGNWRFSFTSGSAGDTEEFKVQDGRVVMQERSVLYDGDPAISGEWPDSPAALKDFAAKYPSYAAFVKKFPKHDWTMGLGQVQKGYRWWVSATAPGVKLYINPGDD